MCGILGYIGEKYSEHDFHLALKALTHRGPDGMKIWHGQNALLGHTRLSIIETGPAGIQPREAFDRYVITFNGEIYNYIELREELIKSGFKFMSHSDTEVLLYAFIHWGTTCLKHLNGMWAFAIWDKHEKTLFLSRDRVGKKPLFYTDESDEFGFASEMKALVKLKGSYEIDYKQLDQAKADNFAYETTEHCLLKNIKRFPAGTYGIYKNQQLTLNKYWFPLEEFVEIPKDYALQKEMFYELFMDACKIRMRSDVTIGTALSGGLDSSSVICMMNHIANKQQVNTDWQHAFVATFPGSFLDETEYAKSVTDHINVKAEFVPINPLIDLNDVTRQAYMFEEIYYAPTIPFVQIYKKERDFGLKVSVDGHGADELFAGYNFDVSPALIDAMPNPLKYLKVMECMTGLSINKANRLNLFKYALVNKYPSLQHLAKNPRIQKRYGHLDALNSRLFESTYLRVLPTLLRNYDRYSMMNGIEIRMPFLDYRILQFAFSISWHSKIRKGYSKAIVRDALAGILPNKIHRRKSKIGFNAPIDNWLKERQFKSWILDEINSSDFQLASTIQPEKVRQALNKLLNRIDNMNWQESSGIFALLSPYFWEKGLKEFALKYE